MARRLQVVGAGAGAGEALRPDADAFDWQATGEYYLNAGAHWMGDPAGAR